jgi:hypothetical protein
MTSSWKLTCLLRLIVLALFGAMGAAIVLMGLYLAGWL